MVVLYQANGLCWCCLTISEQRMCTLRLRGTILAVLCGIEGELIAYCAPYSLTESTLPKL